METNEKLLNIIHKFLNKVEFEEFQRIDGVHIVLDKQNGLFPAIIFHEFNRYCHINYKLLNDICNFFPVDLGEAKHIIYDWVKKKLNIEISYCRIWVG